MVRHTCGLISDLGESERNRGLFNIWQVGVTQRNVAVGPAALRGVDERTAVPTAPPSSHKKTAILARPTK